MKESDIFDEKNETKKAFYTCPFCRERNEYDIRWLKRTKKKKAGGRLNQQEQMQFEKSRDYIVRIDDNLMCKNNRCRRRFDIPDFQSVVFI